MSLMRPALPASLKFLHTLFVRLVLLCLILTQAQLPVVFAAVLIEVDGAQELRVCVHDEEVRLTLHHTAEGLTCGRLLHEHSSAVALLAGDSHASESDHIICFASAGAVTSVQGAEDHPAVAVSEFLSPQPLSSMELCWQAIRDTEVSRDHLSVWYKGLCCPQQLPLLI